MASILTPRRLRQIIKEETRRLREGAGPDGGDSFYRNKLYKLEDALEILNDVAQDEVRIGSEDPDLEDLIRSLEGYIEAVSVMADQEAGNF